MKNSARRARRRCARAAHDALSAAATVLRFFDELGPERTVQIEMITIDMSNAFKSAIAEAAPHAQVVFDRFHVQRLTHDALDKVRREQVRELTGTDDASSVKKTRFALQKNPWNLSQSDHEKLADVQRSNKKLYRAYLLKETLADILDRRQVNVARERLGEWIVPARLRRVSSSNGTSTTGPGSCVESAART